MESYGEKFKILKLVNGVEFTDKLIFEQKHGGKSCIYLWKAQNKN